VNRVNSGTQYSLSASYQNQITDNSLGETANNTFLVRYYFLSTSQSHASSLIWATMADVLLFPKDNSWPCKGCSLRCKTNRIPNIYNLRRGDLRTYCQWFRCDHFTRAFICTLTGLLIFTLAQRGIILVMSLIIKILNPFFAAVSDWSIMHRVGTGKCRQKYSPAITIGKGSRTSYPAHYSNHAIQAGDSEESRR